jgi:hypothetical protein
MHLLLFFPHSKNNYAKKPETREDKEGRMNLGS